MFTKRYRKEHMLPLQPPINIPDAPQAGEHLVFDSDSGKFEPESPVVPNALDGSEVNGDVLIFDTDQYVNETPAVPLVLSGGETDGDVLAFNTDHYEATTPAIPLALTGGESDGDVLVFDTDHYEATTPIVPIVLAGGETDGDVLAFNTDHYEATTPTVALNEAGTLDDEALLWDTGSAAWLASGVRVLAPAYGMLYVADGVAAQALTAAPTKLTAFAANGPSALTTVDHTADSITVTEAGTYYIACQMSFSFSVPTARVEMHLRVDAVEQAAGFHRFLSAGDVGSASFVSLITLTAGQVVTVYAETTSDGNVTVTDGQLIVMRIGP